MEETLGAEPGSWCWKWMSDLPNASTMTDVSQVPVTDFRTAFLVDVVTQSRICFSAMQSRKVRVRWLSGILPWHGLAEICDSMTVGALL